MTHTIDLSKHMFKNADTETKIAEKSQENFVVGNRIYILGPFDRSISSEVIPAVIELIDQLKSEKDPSFEVYINSYGGYAAELFGLIAVLDIAKANGIEVITYNLGVAMSCGSLLAVTGDYRYMHKYATNLPHLGQMGMTLSTVEQLERNAKRVAEHFAKIYTIYAAHTKLNKKQLDKVLKDDDYFMSADECLKCGFCDEII